MTDSSSCSLTIEGVKYDITSFQKHHPGGNVISFYKGLDATDVFHTFHVKSQRARNMLKSLKVIEVDKTSAQSDFQHMVEGWKKKGYCDSNHDDFILWGGIVSAITYTGLVVQERDIPSWGASLPALAGRIAGLYSTMRGIWDSQASPSTTTLCKIYLKGYSKGGRDPGGEIATTSTTLCQIRLGMMAICAPRPFLPGTTCW